jgi:hypothetical protein
VVDDLGFVALRDLAHAVGDDPAAPYCVIGGHMVTALVAQWQLGAELWRCLEVAFAAGLNPSNFREGIPAEGAAVVRSLFASRDGHGMTALVSEQRLSPPGADERFTRIRALVARVLGSA